RFVIGRVLDHERDVHALNAGELVRIQFRKHELLRQAQTVAAVAVERLAADAAEVAHTGQGQRDQPVHELVHLPTTKGHFAADLHVFAEAEAEMALRAIVMIGFWPVIRLMASAAVSRCFFSWVAAPTPMLTTIFSNRGSESVFLRPNF